MPTALALSAPEIRDPRLQEFHSHAFDNYQDAMLICDASSQILAVNSAFERMSGLNASLVVGKTPAALPPNLVPSEIFQQLWATACRIGAWSTELIDRRRSGAIYRRTLAISAIHLKHCNEPCYLLTFSAAPFRQLSDDHIDHRADKDPLTDLMNRYAFDTVLARNIEIARERNERLCLIYLDLDGFKKINDSLGHAFGDDLLRVISTRIRGSLRENDVVARLGGDEFAIMLPPQQMERQAAEIVVQRLLQVACDPVDIAGHLLSVGASIGIAAYPDDAASSRQLMQHADTAMHAAKNQGSNAYCFFSKKLHQAATERLEVEELIRKHLVTSSMDGFHLLYQPQYSIPERKLVGLEALLRMRDPSGDVLSPSVFIPVAEEPGLIVHLGEWVIDEACRQVRAWLDAGLESVPVSINISSRQFKSPSLEAHILASVAKHGISPANLILEITESVAMVDPIRVVQIMRSIKHFGIGLSLDDFGTGYSSLSYLPRFPLDALKIDRSFISCIEQDNAAASICSATIALAHNLGLTVVAEGVENEHQVAFLQQHKCDVIQGFLVGKPLPPNDVTSLLQTTARAYQEQVAA